MKRLWLTNVPDDYHPNKDILLGPWCILGKEDKYFDLENLIFEPDAFNSKEEIINASKLTSNISEIYLKKIYQKLNKELKVSYSYGFWRILLTPWLITLIQTTWEKEILMNKIVKKYYNQNIEIELADDIEWNFNSTHEFLTKGIKNIDYNFWLFSRLLEKQISPKWKINYRSINQNIQNKDAKRPQRLISKIYYYLKELFPTFSVYGINIFDALMLEFLLKLKTIKPKKISALDLNLQMHEAQKNNDNSKVDFDFFIAKTLPKDILNNVKNINNFLQWMNKKYILIGPVIYYDEKRKAQAAVAVENGANLIIAQHGGSYGVAAVHSMPTAIEYVHSAFFSWGWTQTNYTSSSSSSIIPFSSPLLSKFLYKRQTNKVIFVNTAMYSLQQRISSSPQPNQWVLERNNILNLIEHLDDNVYKDFWYRPFFKSPGSLADKEFIKNKYPSINVLEGKLHIELMKCKLAILNHPDTTLNIALAANIPTICIWNSDSWYFDVYADKYFDELKNVGIIFHDPLKAAKKINEIWQDIDNWWNQEKIQKARKKWCYQYARTNKFWRKEWVKALWKI